MKKYIRDGRAPIPKEKLTSEIMSRIRAKNTKPELLLRKALRRIGLKQFKLHDKKLPGRADISFPKNKLAIFVNGCYWHRCPKCKPAMPKTHIKFWGDKFKRNKVRDKKKILLLSKLGWESVVVWECEIKKNISKVTLKIKRLISIR
jgi:DNA mismatch endonuclease (patch repair protein)